jgi:aspartyl-tRNA(Asn)/glutamyl-tRNA(Gln) amidotransferase subunit C
MKVTKTEILRVAGLAHLKIAESEIDAYTKKFNDILGHIDQLNQLDTKGVIPMSGPLDIPTPMRADGKPLPSFSADEALKNAPERFADFLLVPKVVES